MLRHGFLLKLSEVEQMNKSIVDSYGTAANCDIAQEEAAELIHAVSKWKRVNGTGYKIDTTREDALETLIQAVSDCQNALDSMVYSLLLDRDAIKKKIEEADERAERLYRGKV
jgi:hypothetical protein